MALHANTPFTILVCVPVHTHVLVCNKRSHAVNDFMYMQDASESVEKVSEEGHTLTNSIVESENGSFKETPADNALVKEEEKEVGVVALSVYKSYWLAVGFVLTPMILLSLFLMQGKVRVCIHHNSGSGN